MAVTLLPPAAGDTVTFLQKCIQCGRCAAVCTFDAIKIRSGVSMDTGSPYIDPNEAPCFLCMHCGPVCPTQALPVVEQLEADMGVAKLNESMCFTYMGAILCRTCFERCPVRTRALVLDKGDYPRITNECVGCGVCAYVCPQKAIEIIPRSAKKTGGE